MTVGGGGTTSVTVGGGASTSVTVGRWFQVGMLGYGRPFWDQQTFGVGRLAMTSPSRPRV